MSKELTVDRLREVLDYDQFTGVFRLKNDHLESVLQMLAAAGLKVVSADRVCVKRDEWALVTKITARTLANEQTAMSLLFEETE